MLKSIRSQPNLHSSQDECNIYRCRRQPCKVILKEPLIVVPLRHVAAHEGILRETVDLVKATKA